LRLRDLRGAQRANDTNQDGTVVVGYEAQVTNLSRATRWTGQDSRVPLDFLVNATPGNAVAFATDGDGNLVVGYGTPSPSSNQDHVVSWKASLWGANDLGTLPAGNAPTGAAHGVSADGTIVVGRSGEGSVTSHQAFEWTQQSGYTLLGYADGGQGDASLRYSAAFAISADGLVIAGAASDASGTPLPVLWTTAGVKALGNLASGGSGQGQANAANGDGSVIVGSIQGPSGLEAFRWTAKAMEGLGDLSGGDFASVAYDVSGDGQHIVGTGSSAAKPTGEAFFWDESGGMRTLKEAMQEHGFEDTLTDWTLQSALAISADGKVVVGCALSA
jgi:uncharacterized membrane protein